MPTNSFEKLLIFDLDQFKIIFCHNTYVFFIVIIATLQCIYSDEL